LKRPHHKKRISKKQLLRNALLIAFGSAITLLAQTGLPAIGLSLYGKSFRAAYLDCQLANVHAAALNTLQLDVRLSQQLRKTEEIDQLSCLEYRKLRDRLQQFKVSSAKLDLIEALAASGTLRNETDDAHRYRIGVDRASFDKELSKVVDMYGLRPLKIRRYEADPKWKLGQALFFDPVLSGNRDVSCSTCHLLQFGLTDGLPRSIGANGQGIGPDRKLSKGVQVHPRRSLDLWNRDNNAVSAFFWDGHVEVLNARTRLFRSPLGDELPNGFQNAMAVQAIFPITIPDEMLGYFGEHSSSTLPEPHDNKPNDLLVSSSYPSERARIRSVHEQLLERLLARNSIPAAWQREYRSMFQEAYAQKSLQELSIVDLGNALAHYEELAFASADSSWDRYIGGDEKAISEQAKIGALVFYGKGRCAACHGGQLFSDFQYHGVGIFDKIYVNGKYINDLGRGTVTGNPSDNYHFRTPSLRNVTKIGLHFHDGSSTTLNDALTRHLEPLANAGAYNADGSFAMEKDQADSVSPILTSGIKLTKDEVKSLLSFLGTLEAQSRSRDQIVPSRVPSGIPVSYP
jgi:cytochrome c peroxidase